MDRKSFRDLADRAPLADLETMLLALADELAGRKLVYAAQSLRQSARVLEQEIRRQARHRRFYGG